MWWMLLFTFTHCLVKGQNNHFTEEDREEYLQRFKYYYLPDSIQRIKVLDSLNHLANKTNDEFFKIFLLVQGYSHQNPKTYDEKILPALLSLEKEDKRFQENDEYRCMLYTELSYIFLTKRNMDKSIHYSLMAKEILDKYGVQSLKLGHHYATVLSSFYYWLYDYENSIKYGIMSAQIKDRTLQNKPIRLNNIGMCYLKMKNYEKAKYYFKQIIYLTQNKEKIVCGIAHANYGNVLRLQGEYRKALPYLYRELDLSCSIAPEDCAITCLYLADCLLHTDSVQKAKFYINKSPSYGPEYSNPNYNLNLMEVMAHYYQKTGQYKLAIEYQQKLLMAKDSTQRLFNNQMLMRTSLKLEEQRRLNERILIQQEERYTTWVRNLILGALAIIFFTVLYILNLKRKKEKQLFELKQQEAEKELLGAKEKMKQYVEDLKEKSAFLEKMEKELQVLKPNITTLERENYLNELQKSVILTEEDWLNFKTLFEQVWPGKLTQFHEKFPELSPAEERLLALTTLNLPSKQIANMLGISIDSLRKSRYRLRKKFPSLLQEEESES
mgnify:FL=1